MGLYAGLIKAVANQLGGMQRPISNGITVEAVQDDLPLRIQIEELHDEFIRVSAWLRPAIHPNDDHVWMMFGFYLQDANAYIHSGKMRWNEHGEFGCQSSIIFEDRDPEYALRRTVDLMAKQIVMFGPGLIQIQKGESSSSVFLEMLPTLSNRVEPTMVSRNDSEYQFLERYARESKQPFEPMIGGVALIPEHFRIELTADTSGRFSIKAIGPQLDIPSGSWNTANFYTALANSNDSFGAVYLHNYTRLASRFDLAQNPGTMPSANLLRACWLSTVRDVSCHTQGIRMIAKGEDAMTALNFAFSLMEDK